MATEGFIIINGPKRQIFRLGQDPPLDDADKLAVDPMRIPYGTGTTNPANPVWDRHQGSIWDRDPYMGQSLLLTVVQLELLGGRYCKQFAVRTAFRLVVSSPKSVIENHTIRPPSR